MKDRDLLLETVVVLFSPRETRGRYGAKMFARDAFPASSRPISIELRSSRRGDVYLLVSMCLAVEPSGRSESVFSRVDILSAMEVL
jgi:hypothetical protein